MFPIREATFLDPEFLGLVYLRGVRLHRLLTAQCIWAIAVILGIFVTPVILAEAASAGPQMIEIRVDTGAFEGPGTWPLGAGVPLPRGIIQSVDALRLRDEKQSLIPMQVTIKTYWPDDSIKWIWLDFQGDPRDRYFLELGSHATSTLQGAFKLRVLREANSLSIDAGPMSIIWDQKYASPRRITLGGTLTIEGDGHGIYVIDSQGRRGTLGGDGADLSWTVETAGPIRAVLRVEGWYVTSQGERIARAIVRYHLYANRTFFTMDHTFIFTEDTDLLWFREVAVKFPRRGSKSSRARFGVNGGDEVTTAISGTEEQAWIFQDDYPHFAQKRSHFSVGLRTAGKEKTLKEGEIGAGWCEASDGSAGVTVAVRDFGPQFPKELLIDSEGITARLWSNRGGKELDYRPATLVKDYYGEDWIAGLTRNVPGGHGIVVGVDPEGFKKLNPTGLGSARTHEIFCGYHADAPDPEVSRHWAATFERQPVALADPAWLCASGAFWPIAPKDEERFPEVERFISEYFDHWLEPTREFSMTGWIARGVGPELGYERREDGQAYTSFYRLNNVAAYNTPKNIWVAYIRSGDRKYLDFAERYTRFLADFKVIHWSGGRTKKQKGLLTVAANVHYPFYWASPGRWDTGGQSTEYMIPFRIAYFLRDMRWARDALEQYNDAVNRLWDFEAVRKSGTPFVLLSQMMNAYRVTGDGKLEKKIHELADALIDLNDPLAFSLKFGTSSSPWARTTYKPDRKIMALIDYYDLFGVEKAKQAVLKANAELFTRSCRKRPLSYQNVTPMYLMRCYAWTGNRDYRSAAVTQLRSALQWFREFESLPDEKKRGSQYQSAFKPDKQGFPFFAVPHILVDFRGSFENEGVFPYLANLGRDEECPIHIMKKAGEPVELLVQIVTLRAESYQRDVSIKVSGPEGRDTDAIVAEALSGAYRIVIPEQSPAGSYGISAGVNRFLVIGYTGEKIVMSFPDGTYLGHKEGAGYALTRDRSYFFYVPREQGTFSMKVSRPIQIKDPSGREIEAARGQTGRIVVPSEGNSGLWSLVPGRAAFVRFEDLAPVVAFGDSRRFFLPPGVRQANPERVWEPPAMDGLADGRFKGGLHVTGEVYRARWDRLSESGNFPFPQGTMECFIRTDWSTKWYPEKGLSSFWTAPPFYFGYRNQPVDNQGMFLTWVQFHPVGESGKGWMYRAEAYASFKAGQWNHIACTWRKDPLRYVIYRNGKKIAELTDPPPEGYEKGSGVISFGPLRATYDELRVSRVVRYEADFIPPTGPFVEDMDTVLLFQFDEDLRGSGRARAVKFVRD